MKRLAAMTVAAAIALLGVSASHAAGMQRSPSQAVRIGTPTFSLAVAGVPDKGTTFWVSYGPLAGRFGVVQLQPTANHLYVARISLPVNRTGTFTYLEAHGEQTVHGIAQPGGIPVVIRTVQSVTAAVLGARTIHWTVPLG